MFANAQRANDAPGFSRRSLMRGVSWLPLAAVALVSNAIDARAQAVNVGGMQARMPAPVRSLNNNVAAGVQRQSPGNNIVTDGLTATNVRVQGRTTTITTSTMSGGNAFNSFKTFSEGQGNTVNLIVPDSAGKLVNIVREGQVNIQGVLNSYQRGKIGGNVVFADSYGIVVGATGSVNVGSLTVVTPNKATIDGMIAGGKINDGLVARVVTGNVPLSSDGSVVINGRVNATQFIKITATDVRIAGSLQAAQRAAEQKAQFAATVNTRGWQGGGKLVAHNGSISISGANSVTVSGTLRAGTARHSGTISVASGKSVRITGSLLAEGATGRNGGKINVTSGGDIAIGKTAKLSVAGVGRNSSAGSIVVKAGSNLAVADGATFNARGGTTGDGGFVELSASKVETLGNVTVDLGATAGRAGSLLLDPADLVIAAADHGYSSFSPNLRTNGGNVILQADNSIMLAADGVIDTTSSSGSGSVSLTAPNIALLGGSRIDASSVSGGAAGTITLTSVAPMAGNASILIGDNSGLRAVITGKDLIFSATSNAGGSTAHATVLMTNADVTATGALDVSALASVSKTVNSVGAIATTDVLAAVDVLDGVRLAVSGLATLRATASTTVNATAAPNALSSQVTDASAAVVDARSTARVHIGGTADVQVTGALNLIAKNTVSSTSSADASGSSAAGATVAVNVLNVETTALIDGSAKIASGPLTLAASSSVSADTVAKAASQGAGEAGSGSKAGQYLSDAKYAPYESTSEGSVKAAGALAIADVTSITLAQMSSTVSAVVSGATVLKSLTGNSSTVIADGSSASGSTGVGVAVAVGLSHVSNKALLEQRIETAGLTLSATMTGTAADNSFSASATSGAAATNVGVAGALSTNLLDSESLARFGSPWARLSGNPVSLTAADLSTATSLAGPSGSGATGGKVGVGASVALNLVATRSTAELADGSSLSGAGDVTLQATGVHGVVTQAEQGSAGGVAVTPVIALTLASDRTRASIGALTGGLDATGDITVGATQQRSVLTQASGSAAGGKAAVGAALAIAVLDEQTIATTSSSIRTTGSVSFTAQGAVLAATAAVASASGGNGTDDAGKSTDKDGSVDDKMARETQGASARQTSAGVGDSDQQATTTTAAQSENGQGKTSDGSVAVAAAIGATVLQSKVQAYVPASVGVTSGALSVTAISNADTKTSADGSAVGSDAATAKVGVGAGLSLNLAQVANNALLGGGTQWSAAPAGAINGVVADNYTVSSLSLKATQDNLGLASPVVTVVSPTPVDPAKQAKASVVGSSGQHLNVFEANASAGAGGSSVGVAGAVALNLVDTQSLAQVADGAAVTVAGHGAVAAISDNESSTIARAMPATSGATGGKVGVGASVALNLVATRSTAELADGSSLSGAGDVTLQATGVHGVVTQAEQGSAGGVAVTPVIALTLASDRTRASIGALTGGLDATGDITVGATQQTSVLTQASGSAAGGKAAVGAALAIAVLDEQTIATTSSSIRTTGSVSFTAQGAVLAATAAVASASGGNGTDDAGKSTDKDGSVDDKVQKQSTDSSARMSTAKIGDSDQQSAVDSGGATANGKASTSEGGVAVAAAIAVDVTLVKVNAFVPLSVGIQAGNALTVSSAANVDAKTSADGSTTAASGSGPSPSKVGVGAAVAVNVIVSDNRAELGASAVSTTAGQIVGVTAGHYDSSALTVSALKTDLGVASPTAVGGADLPHAPFATTTLGRVDQIVAYAKSGSSGADVGIAGSLAVNVLTSKSVADIATGTVVNIVPTAPGDGGVTIASDNEAYVAASALSAQDGASGTKVGVGASVALNTVLNTSESSLAQNAGLTGANSLSVTADSHLDTDALAQAGAKGGTALDAVVAFTILSETTRATIESGGLVSVDGDVTVRATSAGAHSAIAAGSATSSGSGGTAIGGAVALITGTGLFDIIAGRGGPITSDTEAGISRNVASARDLTLSASGTHSYAASATATAGGGSGEDKGAAGGSKSTSSKTLASAPANSSMDQEQSGLSANGGGSSGGKLSVAAALGAAIVGDSVKASLGDSLTLDATRNILVSATSNDKVQSLGSASAVSSNQDNGIGIGAALSIIGNTTKASIGDSAHIVSGGSVTVDAESTLNKGLGGFAAEAMSGASGKKLSVAGALAIGISTSTTSATIGNNLQIDVAGDAISRAGAISVGAENTSSLAAKAWSGSYSAEGTGIGASIAAAISNDSYTASIGNSATINAASVDVHATNQRVDDIFSSIKALAAPVAASLQDINDGLATQASNAASLVGDVDSAAGAVDAVKSFKSGFTDQITADKKKILESLKATATLAQDLPLLGSNNFYTEVVAGSASAEKLAVSGGLALQIMLERTTASIGNGARIDATGAVALAAHDDAISRTLVGALAASGGSSAAGISLGIVVNSGGVDARIGSNSTISQSASIGVVAGARHEIDLFEISAGAADANGIAGILGVVYSGAAVSAQTGAGSVLRSSGAVNVAATNAINTLNLAGGIAIGGNNGIGGVAISTTVNNTATATIDSNAGAATTVDAGSVSVSAQTTERLINVAVAGAGAGSNAIAGVATPLIQILNTQASIGANATIVANAGDVSVTAADNTLLINVGGVISIGGSNGVGGAAAVSVLTDTVKATIGDDATVDATGALTVTANAREIISDAVVSGSGGSNVGVAVAIASSVLVDNVSATIGKRDQIGTIIRPSSVRVEADDTTLIVDLAGSIGAGNTGVGAGVDVNVLTKTTAAAIDSNAVVKSSGDVVVQATSAETVFSLVAGFAAGGQAGVAGSVGAFVLAGNTLATIGSSADIRADRNVGVIARDANELNRLVGSGAVGGSAGVGGAIGVSVAVQNTKATISDDASVEGLGLGGTLGVTTGITGSFSIYGADVLAVLPGTSSLTGTLGNDVNAVTVADGLIEGGSLFVLQRKTTPVVEQVRGVAVSASATSLLRSLAVSGSVAGTAGVSISGDLPVVVSDTEATIGARVKVNKSSGSAPGADESVTVAASSDLYHLGIAGSVAVGGTAGVGAGAETAVFRNTTIASIGAGSDVSATRNVAVTAKASENFAGSAVSAAAGGTAGVAGGLTGFVSVNTTKATIDSSATSVTRVSADGNVIVDAEDQTRAVVTDGTIAIGGAAAGVGIGVGLAVIVKETEASIGASADVTGLGNGANNDLTEYTGADFATTRSGRGVLVQANSGQSVTGIVLAGAGGLYAGVAGAIAAEVFVDQTRAGIGQGATINRGLGVANASQDVTVTARNSTVISMVEGTVAVGLAGVGGAVDVAVIADATSAYVGDDTTINAARYVTVDALTNRQTSSTVASVAGGLVGVGAAISVLAVANGPNADQTSRTDRNGSFNDSANQKLSDDTIDSKFLSSSTDVNVRSASTKAQGYKSALNLQPALPTGIAPGNSATIGRATINAGNDVSVRARDVVNAVIADGVVAAGIGGGAGIGVAVVDVKNSATVTNGANITAGAIEVSAVSDRTLDGYGVAATVSGVSAALMSLTDVTSTTATISASSVNAGGNAQVNATNNETIRIATATLASGAAGGLSLVVVKPDTEARIDGASTIDAALATDGVVGINAANNINITSGAAGIAVGGGGVGLTVITELPTTIAKVGAGSDIASGVLGASATAGDVMVSATTQETLVSVGAGASLGDGVGGALTIVTRTEKTNAEVEAVTITATGNVGVIANSTSADDLAIGGAAGGGGAGVGGSLGVTVLSSSVTASIDADADVTALGLGADLTYIKAYQTSFSDYVSGDRIKAASVQGVSGGADIQMPLSTSDVSQIGSYLLLKKGTITATTANARGVVVSAAKAESVRSVAVSGGLGGLVGVGLTGNVPVILDTTAATIGANAKINQRLTASAGSLQSAIVDATSDTYLLNIAGAVAGGGAAGIGASVSTAIISNATTATIGESADVSAKNNVAVIALAEEDIAMVAAAGAAGGFVGIAGGLSLISIDNNTKALIDKSAVVVADNNVMVVANDVTREATFAGSIVLSGGGSVGAAVSVGLINKNTEAVIDSNAHVSGLAKGSDTFVELTGSGVTASRNAKGVLVDAESVESAYIFALGAGGGLYVAAAGAIAVDVFNTNTFATINSGAVINGVAGGAAQQDVAVTARDLTGIVTMNHGISLSGLASLAGAVDIGVLNSNVGASIGDATVNAGGDVLVNALANKAIDSTAASAAASTVALSAGVSVYAIGNGVDPNGKAVDELKTSDSSGSVTNFAGNSLSVGGSLGSTATSTTSAATSKNSGSSTATSSANSASAILNSRLGAINVTGKTTAQNASVAGTSATIGNAHISAGGAVNLNGSDQVQYTAKTGALSVGGFGVGAGVGIFTDSATTTASMTGNGTGTINAGSISVLANTGHSANLTSYAGSVALLGALEADVALVADNSVTRAGVTGYALSDANGFTIGANSNRNLNATASGVAAALGAGVGVSVAKATIGGAVNTTLQDVTIGSSANASGFFTARATSNDSANATASSAAGGVGGAGSGAESTATVNPTVMLTLTDDTIYSNGAVTLLSQAADSANARSTGVAVAGGLSVGASIANASLAPQVQIAITGGDIEAASLQADANVISSGATAFASGASGAFIGINASEASASDSSQAIANGSGGVIQTTGALNFNATTSERTVANSTGLAVGIVAAGANVSTASTNTQTKATFTNMVKVAGGSISLDAESTANNAATATSGSGGVIAGASSTSKTISNSVTVAQISGTLGGIRTIVDASPGMLSLIAHHADVFSGSVDSTQAALAGMSGARLSQSVSSAVSAGFGYNVAASARDLTVDAANKVSRFFICETGCGIAPGAVDLMGWDVKSGSGGFLDAPAATGTTTVQVSTLANFGQNANVHLIIPPTGTNLASISAANDIVVHQKTKVDSGGAISIASGESNVTVSATATVAFNQSSSLVVDVGDLRAAAWSNVDVDARTAVSTSGLAGAPSGAATANVTVNNLLSTAKNVRVEASSGVFPLDGTLPTNGSITLLSGRNFNNQPGSFSLNTIVDLYNNTAFPVSTTPTAQSNLTNNSIVSIAQSDAPPVSGVDPRYGINAAGDIYIFADKGVASIRADGTGTNIYLEALSKVGSAISKFFGGGEVSFNVKGGSTSQTGSSTLLIDGIVDTGIARTKSLSVIYRPVSAAAPNGCDPSNVSCIQLPGGSIGATASTDQAGGAVLDRLSQIDALLAQYGSDVIAKAAYQSEKTFLQNKLVGLGLATGSGATFVLNSAVTPSTIAANYSQNLAALTDGLSAFQNQVTTTIGSVLSAGLTNISLAWNGKDLDGNPDLNATVYAVTKNATSTLDSYKNLSNYSAINGGNSSASNTFRTTVGDVADQIGAGDTAIESARLALNDIKSSAADIATQVSTIVSTQQDVAQGNKPFVSVDLDLQSYFAKISTDQHTIVDRNTTFLTSVSAVKTAGIAISDDLSSIQIAATAGNPTSGDRAIISGLNTVDPNAATNPNPALTGLLTRINNSREFIRVQIEGGNLASGAGASTAITGLSSTIANYATQVAMPSTGMSIEDWRVDLNTKAQAAASPGTSGTAGTIVVLKLDNASTQLGNIYLGAETVKSGTGNGKIYAPGDARIDIVNETAATLQIQNLNIPINNAGRITVNGAEIKTAADITAVTGRASGFTDANIVTGTKTGSSQVNITSNYNPESAAYYDAGSTIRYINKLQVAPDIILLSGSTINNLNGSVTLTSQAGNIYLRGNINAGSVSIIARNGDLVTSYVNGFNHVGGDPAGSTLVPGSAVIPADQIPTGLGIVANGQIFLAARYLNINSTVQSGIANYDLTVDLTTQLVTTDATRVGLDANTVNGMITSYRDAVNKTNLPIIYTFSNGVTVNLSTGDLTFSIATAKTFSGAFKFVDSGSGKTDGIYSAQAGASYDATNNQIVIDGTSVKGGYIKIFGQIINTSDTNAGNLNVLDGFGTINVTNNTGIAVVLQTLNAGADPTGTGRGTAGVIDITDVHIDGINPNIVDATHTIFTRDLDAVSGTRKVMVTQQQGIIDAVTGLFVEKVGAPLTSTASSTGDRTGIYNPMLYQRYVWTTAADYTVNNSFSATSDNLFGSSALALNSQTAWQGVSATRTPSIKLLDGSYVSVAVTDTTTQTVDGTTLLVAGTTTGTTSNADLAATTLKTNTIKYQKSNTLNQTGSEQNCNWYTLCIASRSTVYYDLSTNYREITTYSMRADNPIKVNFIGADVGTINVTSGTNITLKGNITNVAGTTTITAQNGASILQSSANPTITSQSINLSAGGTVGEASNPLIIALTDIKGARGQLDARAGDGVVAIRSAADIIVGQVTAAGSVVAGKGSIMLSAGTDIKAASANSLIQADRVSLTALTGSIGSVASGDALTVNTGFTTDQSLRPFGDPATKSGLTAYYGLSASAAGDINIRAKSWANNTSATILANSIVSSGGDVKLTTAGRVLDGNPIEQIDKRTYQQLVDYWDLLGLTAGAANAARQADTIKAFEQSQTQAYRQYWQIRDSQPNKGAAFDPTYQVAYTKGTAQYQNLDAYYRNLEIINNGGVAPADIEARIANDISNQAAADTARYRVLNTQVGSLTNSFDSGFAYTASAAEQASLTQGAVWTKTALGFPLSAGALKTVTNTNPVIKAPNISGRNVTILADAGIGESVVVAGQSTPGITINPTNDPVKDLSDAQKVALATAERSDLVLTIGGVQLPANATAEQIAAYQAAVALGISATSTDIPLGTDEANMTAVQRAALDAAAAGIATSSGTHLTVLSKRPINVAGSQAFNATVTAQVSTSDTDQGKAFVASRGDLALGDVTVAGETRIKAIGSLTNATASTIQTGSIVLESANGSIGGISPLVLNLLPNATITARALNAVNLSELPGNVNGSADAIIDTVYSPNRVTIRAAGSILNANNDLQVNVLGGNIRLAADTGSIGSLTNSLNVGTLPGGSINAMATYGMVNLYGVAGLDFTIGSDIAGTSTKLVAAVDGTINGPVTAGTDITISAGRRLVLTPSGNVISGAGQVQLSSDNLEMLENAKIVADLGAIQIETVNDALVSGLVSGNGGIDMSVGGRLVLTRSASLMSGAGPIQVSADAFEMLGDASITASLGSVRISIVNDALVGGLVSGNGGIDMLVGGRLVLTRSASLMSGAGPIQVSADELKMLRDASITASLGSVRISIVNDALVGGLVSGNGGIDMSVGGRLVLTRSASLMSGAGSIQVSADELKMLRDASITASLGSVQISTVKDALVSGIMSGSGDINAISINAGGRLLAGSDPLRAFDLSAIAPGAGIKLVAGLGIGAETEADLYALDQKGSAAGSANLITAVANPFIIRTNAIDAATTVGDVNLIAATSIAAGSVVTGGGSINVLAKQDFRVSNLLATHGDVAVTAAGSLAAGNVLATHDLAGRLGRVFFSANDITFGTINADGRGDLLSSNFIFGNSIKNGGALTEEAGGDINVIYTRATSLQAQTPTSVTFGDVTVDNPITVAAQVTDIGALHASASRNAPLLFTLTGYHGGQGLRANVYVDAPLGVVMPLLREGEADIRTNALDYRFVDATIGRWLKFTTPDVMIWDDNRSSRPVRGFDVQLFQPSKQFFLYQNGFRTDTNAVVVQYGENAEVIERRNNEIMMGGSLVRDIDRIFGINTFGSVLLNDESPESPGPFFRGESFTRFMDTLRDRRVRRPTNGLAVNLKGLASAESIGEGYRIILRGGQ